MCKHFLPLFLLESLPTVTDSLLDRNMDIVSSSQYPSGRVLGPCGNHWNGDGNWSEKDVPWWSCSTCLDPSTLTCLVSPSLTFLCPICPEDPTLPHFYLTSFLFLCLSYFFGPSLPVSRVPGKVIGKGSSLVEMKVAMTKGWRICCNITLDPLVCFLPHFLLFLPVSLHTAAIVLLFPSHLRNSRWCNPSLWSYSDQDTLFSTTVVHSYRFLNLYQVRLSLDSNSTSLRFTLQHFNMKARLIVFCSELVCCTCYRETLHVSNVPWVSLSMFK